MKNEGISFYQVDFSSKNPLDRENIRAYKQIKKIIDENDYELVHCHTPIAGFLTRLATRKKRKKGMKVIYTTHGFSFTHYSSKKDWLKYYFFEKYASRFTDIIITINNEDFIVAQKMHCKNVKKINGVGVDTIKYHDVSIDVDTYKNSLGIPTDKIMVLSVGELSERKNHQIIIKALSVLPNKNKYVYVICGREVGNSGIKNLLLSMAEKMKVNLMLLGHRDDIPQIMHCSDIGAIPSIREGLGLAGIQSLCAEVPLVGSSVQGIKDYIINDVDGYLCSPFDYEAFAKSIDKLSDKSVVIEMKQNCYRIARDFDISVSSKQMREIYCNILKG